MGSQIEVPPDAKIKYLLRRLADLQIIESELAEGIFTRAQTMGHQIKGNASTFELNDLEIYGDRIEAAAYAKDAETIRSELKPLASLIQKYLAELL